MRLGEAGKWWQRAKETLPLALGKGLAVPTNRPAERVGALAAVAVHGDAGVWVEWNAALGETAYRQELQFFLDGRELFDLRLVRETWSLKRLPMFPDQGRHVILVLTGGRDELAEASLAVRELDDRGGGHVWPVAPRIALEQAKDRP